VLYEDALIQVGLQLRCAAGRCDGTLFVGNKLPNAPLAPLGLALAPPASGALQLAMGQVRAGPGLFWGWRWDLGCRRGWADTRRAPWNGVRPAFAVFCVQAARASASHHHPVPAPQNEPRHPKKPQQQPRL
jgi:hypothetical protein